MNTANLIVHRDNMRVVRECDPSSRFHRHKHIAIKCHIWPLSHFTGLLLQLANILANIATRHSHKLSRFAIKLARCKHHYSQPGTTIQVVHVDKQIPTFFTTNLAQQWPRKALSSRHHLISWANHREMLTIGPGHPNNSWHVHRSLTRTLKYSNTELLQTLNKGALTDAQHM